MSDKENAQPVVLPEQIEAELGRQIDPDNPGVASEPERPDLSGREHGEPTQGFFDRFGTGMSTAVEMDWINRAVMDGAPDQTEHDEDFRLTKEFWDEELSDIPQMYHPELAEARSEEGVRQIADRIRSEMEIQKEMEEAGWSGFAGRLVGNFLDPGAAAMVLGTEGMAAPYLLSAKVGRLTRATRSALAAGVSGASLEGITLHARPTKDIQEAAFAGLGSMALGGALGAVMRPIHSPMRQADEELSEAAARSQEAIDADYAEAMIARQGENLRSRELTELDQQIETTRARLREDDEALETLRAQTDELREPARVASARREELEGDPTARLMDQLDAVRTRRPSRGMREVLENPQASRRSGIAARLDDPEVRAEARAQGIGEPPAAGTRMRRVRETGEDGRTRRVRRREVRQDAEEFAQRLMGSASRRQAAARQQAVREETEAAGRLHEADTQLRDRVRGREERADQLERLQRRRRETAERPAREFTPEATDAFTRSTGRQPSADGRVGSTAGAQERTGDFDDPATMVDPEGVIRPSDASEQAQDFTYRSGLRIDTFARLVRSENPDIRFLTRLILADPTGPDPRSGRTAEVSAAEHGIRWIESDLTNAIPHLDNAWRDYVKRTSQGAGRAVVSEHNLQARSEFMGMVSRYIADGRHGDQPEVVQAASAIQDTFKRVKDRAAHYGVEGFVGMPDDASYITRSVNFDKMAHEVQQQNINREQIQEVVFRSMMNHSENEGLEEDVARRIAKAWTDRFVSRGYGSDIDAQRAFFGRDLDEVSRIVRDTTQDEELVDRLLQEATRRNQHEQQGALGETQKRIRMNTNTEVQINPPNNPHGVRTVTVEDFLEMDAERLLSQYIRKVNGETAIVKKLRESERRAAIETRDMGEEPPVSPERPMNASRELNRWIKQAQMNDNPDPNNLELLEAGINMVRGRPPWNKNMNTTTHALFRALRDLNFTIYMGQTGAAAVPEAGNAITTAGWRYAMRAMGRPDRMSVRSRKDGRVHDPVLDQLEAADAVIGNEHLLYRRPVSDDEYGQRATGRRLGRLERGLDVAKRGVGFWSGLRPLTNALAKMAMGGQVDKLTRQALQNARAASGNGARSFSETDLARFRDMGLDEDTLDRVMNQMYTYQRDVQAESGRWHKTPGVDYWDDIDAREAFAAAMHKASHQSVQREMIGELPSFMYSDVGRFIFQFRSWVMNSWGKQLMRGMKHRDVYTAHSVILSSFLAGGTYVAQQHINALGRDDADDYLDRQLQPEEIGKAAFQRSTWAALMPQAIETANWLNPMTDDPIFAYRVSGLGSDLASGAPGVATLDSMTRSLEAATQTPLDSDRDFSQEDLSALQGMAPFGNMWGVRNVFNAIEREFNLPRYSTDEEANPFNQ